MAKTFAEFNARKRIEQKKWGKVGKALYNLMNNAVWGKTTKNLRNRIDLTLVSNEKDRLKWTSIPSYMSQNIFGNNLVTIRKSIHLHLRKSYINA